MKRFAFAIFLLMAFTGREIDFPTDESGKYAFIAVVRIPGASKAVLYDRGRAFLTRVKVSASERDHLSENADDATLGKKGSFKVYKPGSLKKHPAGVVEYHIRLEFKDGRYRYVITNFMFNEYKRNRYGKFEPVKGKYVPLEKEVSALYAVNWNTYRKTVYEKSVNLIKNLNEALKPELPPEPKAGETDDDW